MIINSPYISGSLTVTGNIIASGSITLSGSVASASYAANADLLDGLDATVFTLTSSFNSQTASFTAFTSSILAQTASLNSFSASILSYTASQNILNGTYTLTSSFVAQTASFNAFSASVLATTASLNSFSSSVLTFTGSAATRLGALEAATASLYTTTGSQNTRLGALEAATASLYTATSSFNAFSASLNSYTSSTDAKIASIYSTTSSLNTRVGTLEAYTASLNAKTSSFATTGSNTFVGTQTITGSLLQSGSFTSTGTITAQTLVVQTITSSVIYSSGSNIFGNNIANTQVFSGSLYQTGSLAFFAGSVGIGSSSPGAKLDVSGDIFGRGVIFGYASSTQYGGLSYGLLGSTDGFLFLKTGGTTTVQIQASGSSYFNAGNVGIGTTAPSAKLHIGESGAAAQLWLQRTDGYNPVKLIGGTLADGNGFKITINTTDAFAITSGGNVGIGTTSPNAMLDAYTTQGGSTISATHGTGGSYPKASGISFGATSTSLTVSNNGGTTTFTGGAGIYATNSAASNNPTDLVFWTTSGGTPATRLTIASTGATTFTSTINVSSSVTAGSNSTIVSSDGTYGAGYGSIGFGGNSNGYNRVFGGVGTADGLFLASATGKAIYFRPNGGTTDSVTINTSGNVGIGTTSPSYLLDVNGTGRFSGDVTIKNTSTSANLFIDAAAAGGSEAGLYFKNGGTNKWENYTANNDTALNWYSYANSTIVFKLASTGAATFSSSVTAGGTITLNAPSANYATINLNGAAGYGTEMKFGEATGGYTAAIRHNYNVGGGLEVYTGGIALANLALYIGTSLTATFYSSITAVRGFFNSGGNATDPIISVTGDTNTGFFFPSADTIATTTAGTERMRITSGGNIGIGTTSPITKLQIGSNTFAGGNGVYSNDRIGMMVNGILTSYVYASTYNDPTYPDYGLVFIHGTNTSSYNVWSISPDGPAKGSGLHFIYGANATNIHSTTPKISFIGSSGNVGIGTTLPIEKLEVNGSIGHNNGSTNKSIEFFKTISASTSPTNLYTVIVNTGNTAVFYEVIVFGDDWAAHSAARTIKRGFFCPNTGYTAHNVIESAGLYAANITLGYSQSSNTFTTTLTLDSGTSDLNCHIRLVGNILSYS